MRVDGITVADIGTGLLLLVGFTQNDGDNDLGWMADKIAGLRIFEDAEGMMNLSLGDIGGEVLVVSQFTLYADARKGRRPSFTAAAPADRAKELYQSFLGHMRAKHIPTKSGVFGARMEVELVNDGPVTIILDSPRAS